MSYIEFTVLKAFTSEFKLRTNPIKAFSGMCVQLTSITFPVIWSSMLISVTQEWKFPINNIELKCSFFLCRKYHKSWSSGAAELLVSVDLLCGTTTAELHNLLRTYTMAAELHNLVNLLCGTTAVELNPVWYMRRESHTFSKDSDKLSWQIWRFSIWHAIKLEFSKLP